LNTAVASRRNLGASSDRGQSTSYLYLWLLVALVFEYARPGSFVSGLNTLRLNSLIPLGLVVACLFARNLRSFDEIRRDPITKWVVIYFGLIALSMVHAEVTLYTYTVLTGALGYVFFTFVIVRICTTFERIRGVFAVLILAHLFLLAMNPAVVLSPQQRHYIAGATFLGDGNDFSLSVCILIPMAIELALASKSRLRQLITWGAVVVLILAVIGTQSRGGTLGLMALGAYLWWRSPRKGSTLFLALVVVVVIFAYAPEEYFGRMQTITEYHQDGSAMGRITAWKAAIRMCLDNPLLGVGAGMFPVSFGTDYRPAEHMPWLTAHSMYFLVLGELAVPGIVALLVLVIGNIRANQRVVRFQADPLPGATTAFKSDHSRPLQLLNASMIGFAVAGAFLSVSYYPHIFVLSGLMIAARCAAGRANETSPGGATLRRRPVRSGGMTNQPATPSKVAGAVRRFR
jgi:probable O-glycosylation ligase (exosortase A-associated)